MKVKEIIEEGMDVCWGSWDGEGGGVNKGIAVNREVAIDIHC